MNEATYRKLTSEDLKADSSNSAVTTSTQEKAGFLATARQTRPAMAAQNRPDHWFEGDAEREQARERTSCYRQLLATTKVFAPLIGAIMRQPGEGASDEERLEAFTQLCGAAESIVGDLLKQVNVEEERAKRWIKSQLMQTVVVQLADQWIATSGKLRQPVLECWQRVFEKAPEMPSEDYRASALTPQAALQLSLLKAMAPVLQEVGAFRFFHRDIQALGQRIGSYLVSQALEGADRLTARDNRSREDHLFTVQSLLNSAGRLYAHAWRVEGQRQLTQLSALPKQDPRRKQATEQGLPLEGVENLFKAHFNLLLESALGAANAVNALQAPTSDKQAQFSSPGPEHA